MKLYKFTCCKCGSCCMDKKLIVTLTHHDVIKFFFDLKLTIEELMDKLAFYQVQKNNKDLINRLVYPPFIINDSYHILGLYKKGDGSCIFFEDDYCSIYKYRPKICRSFPFTFITRENQIQVHINKRAIETCKGLNQGQIVNFKKLKELGMEILKSKQEYVKLIELWNNLVSKNILDSSPVIFIHFILGNINLKLEDR